MPPCAIVLFYDGDLWPPRTVTHYTTHMPHACSTFEAYVLFWTLTQTLFPVDFTLLSPVAARRLLRAPGLLSVLQSIARYRAGRVNALGNGCMSGDARGEKRASSEMCVKPRRGSTYIPLACERNCKNAMIMATAGTSAEIHAQ